VGTLLYVKFYNATWEGDGYARGYSGGKAGGTLTEVHPDGTVTLAMVPMFKYDEDGAVRDCSYSYGSNHGPGCDGSAPSGDSYSYSYDYGYQLINTSEPSMELKRCRMEPNAVGRLFYVRLSYLKLNNMPTT